MRLDDFDYTLPDDRIAQVPVEPRDAARLLVDRGAAAPEHGHVRDLAHLLGPGDLLVVNDSKVIPARLALRRVTGGVAEVLLLEPLDAERRTWEAMVRPARKLRVGELPPYITTPLERRDRYQTVYASEPASAAAPTAGLHFTPELLAQLSDRGVELARVELVVGLDTFKPVSAADPREHQIHSERYRVAPDVLDRCREARRVIAVGTTSARALESAAGSGRLEGRTRLFIHRPYDWQVVDLLMTNFHMPRTTLLMMIDAFVGDRWRRLYQVALDEGYRFLSFGDAMLLDRRAG
ncbi:MAG: S-adenosylmethionine:tRNA ribosyltransferase-isomerase [Actinobacteria bacterium]|nr:S-adenosylmethionine:tRNA ribosyltransferase-isomerase [Actinomycetota bacterium]